MKARKFIPLLVVAAGLLAYANSFSGSFIFDDVVSIPGNPTIRHLWPIWLPLSPPHRGGISVEGRPVINLSLAINYALGGYHVWGYHALNLIVHILAGLTLFGIVRRTLLQPRLRDRFGAGADGLALAIAVLWIVHPLQTESVTYIIQRAESITGLFYLLTLYCFIRGVESASVAAQQRGPTNNVAELELGPTGSAALPSTLWFALSVTACVLGMASKQVMASAPLMVLFYDRAFLSGSFRDAWRRRRPLYLALASTWIVLGYLQVSAGSFHDTFTNARIGGLNQWTYLLTQPGVILHYLRLSLWPNPLCFDYFGWPIPRTWTSILPPTLIITILLGASAYAWKHNSVWGFLGAWFFLILAASSSFIPTDSPAYEHRMYLPLAAVVVFGVMAIHSLMGRHSVAVIIVLAIGLGVLTWLRNQDYRSALTIWQDTVVKRPDNPRAHDSLGNALQASGNFPEAITHFEQALQLRSDYVGAHNNLAVALWQLGERQEAIGHWEQALQIQPDHVETHNNFGLAMEQLGKRPEAIAHYKQALRLKPDYAEAHYNLGLVLLQTDNVKEAIGEFEQATRINPDWAEAYYELGLTLYQSGNPQKAAEQWEHALHLKPDYAEAQEKLTQLRPVR